VVEDELEDAVAVWDAERGSVQAGFSLDGEERGADVRVEHGELELEVVQAGVGHPTALGVVPGDARLKCLWIIVIAKSFFG